MEYISGGVYAKTNCEAGLDNTLFGQITVMNNSFSGDRKIEMIYPLLLFFTVNNVTISSNTFYTYFSKSDSFENSIHLDSLSSCALSEDDGRSKFVIIENNTFQMYPQSVPSPTYKTFL